MVGRLHRKPGHPYYIFSPGYRESSSGICVLHFLCHALNLEGFDAYLVGADKFNPILKTPCLSDVIVEEHAARGLTPVVVYPETVAGNPLNASVCVRYMLNKEGVIGKNRVEANPSDLYFYYSEAFVPSDAGEQRLLTVPVYDTKLFSPDPLVERTKKYLYLNRIPREAVDFSDLPDDIEVMSMETPRSLQELSELLKRAEVLYSYELTGTMTLAMMSGCPVVALNLEGFEHLGFSSQNLAFYEGNGYTTEDTPEGISRARATAAQVRDLYDQIEDRFWKQLEVFVEKTQERAAEVKGSRSNTVSDWFSMRVLNSKQRELVLGRVPKNALLGVIIVDPRGDSVGLEKTLQSLERIQAEATVQPLVFTKNGVSKSGIKMYDLVPDALVESINDVLANSNFSWFLIVEAGDEFACGGILQALLDLANAPECHAVYADELIRQEGVDQGLLLRPDLNLDMLLSMPVSMTRHWFFQLDMWRELGGFSKEAGRSFEFEYILRLIECKGFSGLGHINEPVLISDAETLQDSSDERAIIERHLRRRGFQRATAETRLPGRYEIDYAHSLQPKVSIVVVVKDSLARAQRCMESILEKTAYPKFEVLLLDPGNAKPPLRHWLSGIEQMGVKGLRVLRFDAKSSREQIQNQAAQHATGEYLLWLGDGAGILSADWLKQLLNHALRPEVGAVGAKLISGDGLIRHAGGILGLGGPVGRAFLGCKADEPGYMQRLQVDQNYSVVSGLCMMVRRELFLELGGFTEDPKLARWADADFCLRLQQAGYLNVWTPRAQLLMDEPPLSSASTEEEDAMYERWLPVLARDPAYNPNFTLNDQQGFKLAPAQFTWKPLQALGVPLILAHNADNTGCGQYRVIQPHRALKEAGLIDGQVAGNYLTVTELERYNPDSIILQRQIGETHYELMRRMKKFSRAFKVFELDDYIPNLPVKSIHRAAMPKGIVKSLRRALTCVDRFVVSTEPLAEAFAGMHEDIRVVKNRLDPRWWKGLVSERRVSKKPRVGWAGGSSHTGDLEMMVDVVRELANEVDWVFFGMCPDKLRPYVHEFHPGVDIEKYPAALARMNLDLAIAPVEENLFNECKSNLRLLEYGACGFPVVCSDLVCYRGDLPVTRVRNRFKDWVDAIRMHLSDLDATAKLGDELRAAVHRDWMLEGDNLELWRKAWLPG